MRDFTIRRYQSLLKELINQSVAFQTFQEYLEKPKTKTVILRHDVDLLPQNSLRFAHIQHNLGIKGTYNFRAVPESWDENIIKEIADLGHEVGYHYESLTTCKGNIEEAIKDFEQNLDKLRQLVPVSTICMHGSPRSPYDSKDLWKRYSYRDFGIIGEPYFDIDFSEVFYLTDTGRRWDGEKVSVRDKVTNHKSLITNFHRTNDIILAIKEERLLNIGEVPTKIMFTFHPQRWTNRTIPWVKELVFQNIKNVIKRVLITVKK